MIGEIFHVKSLVSYLLLSYPIIMDFTDNSISEIFFVDGAESALTRDQKETLSSAAAHFIECFDIDDEIDVYISKKSVLHKVGGANALAWHVPPQYNRDNHIVCVFVDPEATLKSMIISLAREMIHAWQVHMRRHGRNKLEEAGLF